MGKPTSSKKKVNHNMGKRWKTKYCYKPREIDQINEDLAPEAACMLLNQRIDADKTGEAQHYCIHCAAYFIDRRTLTIHFKTKAHKKRLKALRLEPHSQDEAERAAGKGNFIMPDERIVRDMTVTDQVRDPVYLQDLNEKKVKDIKESMEVSEEDVGKKKKKETVFLPVKSAKK